jgi:hypothetical protein
LREAAEEAAPLAAGVLRGHEHRAAPLAADGEALHEAQHDHEDRRPHADRGVAGHQAHRERRETHHRQRDDQRGLAPEAVAEMTEHEAADRSRDEPDREGGERGKRARDL